MLLWDTKTCVYIYALSYLTTWLPSNDHVLSQRCRKYENVNRDLGPEYTTARSIVQNWRKQKQRDQTHRLLRMRIAPTSIGAYLSHHGRKYGCSEVDGGVKSGSVCIRSLHLVRVGVCGCVYAHAYIIVF
jgi:hypothetical protein